MAPSGSGSGADRPRLRVGQVVEVAIDALDDAARGIGSARGWPVSLPGTLPGERARAELVHVDRRGRGHARLLEVLDASPDRLDPGCRQFLRCGGCELLHASPELRRAYLRAYVASALSLPLERVDPVVESPRRLGYRALAKLVVGPGGSLGSYAPRSHEVADMAGCRVHAPEVERIADLLRSRPELLTGVRYVLIRASLTEGRALVTVVVRAPVVLERLAALLGAREDVAGLFVHENDSPGDELLGRGPIVPIFSKGEVHDRFGLVRQRLQPGAFAQVNPLAAGELYRRVVELADAGGEGVVDLYSGSGGIGISLALAGARRVVLVEELRAGVEAARVTALENGVADRVEAREGTVEEVSRAITGSGGHFGVVTLNPPRKGASPEVLASITRLAPARVVYVSCNPETLGRDLVALAQGTGLMLSTVTPVDLFPATRHVETIALLAREHRASAPSVTASGP